jgi:Calcineurin-like phosphoesterase/Iron/zinc purple acid phosphatase-like protein C
MFLSSRSRLIKVSSPDTKCCPILRKAKVRWIFCCLFIILIVISSGRFPLFPSSFALAERPDFNIVAAGDWGCGMQANITLDSILKKQPEVVLALGDLSYEKTAGCWLNLVKPIIGKLKIAIGFHDLDQNGKYSREEQYLKAINLSKPYYSFNYQNVHFVALATEIAYNVTDGQLLNVDEYRFLDTDLNKASKMNNINWIIVFGYRPLYSSPSLHNASGILRDTYHPLFDKYGVDLVLQAHNHNYQRTYPLRYNPDRPASPTIDNTSGLHHSNYYSGPIFITAGTAGKDLYGFTGKAPYVVMQLLRNGFLNINVTKNGTSLETSFIDSNNGKVLDQNLMVKKLSG